MTEEIPPHIRRHQISQRQKSLSRQTMAYLDHARGASAALTALNQHRDGMQDAALKIRCSFSDPAVPSEGDVDKAIGTEAMRILGPATTLFIDVDLVETLGSPTKVTPLAAAAYQTACDLNAALSEEIKSEHSAAQNQIMTALLHSPIR